MSSLKRIMLFTYKNQKQVNMLMGIVAMILLCVMVYLYRKEQTFLFGFLGALGSLATFATFIVLLLKDKFKQDQIDRLTNIVEVLESQNETMKAHNDLVSQQVTIFRNTNLLQGQDGGAMQMLRDIEEKKLKLSVRPNLWLNGSSVRGNTGELSIDLNNKGEDARLLEFRLKSEDIHLHSESLPWDLEKGSRRYVFGRTNGQKPIGDCKYEIDIIYKDKLNNHFSSKITGIGGRVKLGEPQDIPTPVPPQAN